MAVSVVHDNDIKKGLAKLFVELRFSPGMRVFIKPNLCGRDPILPGENTSVQVMDGLIAVLLDKGCTAIVIGHGQLLGSFDHAVPFDEMLRTSGFDKYTRMPGVEIINLDDMSRQTISLTKWGG